MAIQELRVFGFRSFKDVRWHPGRLNLLVGPNGSGKSNLIHCLELIGKVAKGRLEGTLSDQGGIVPFLWDHQPGSCGWRLRIDPVDEPRDRIRDALTFEFEMSQLHGGSAYEITKDCLGNRHKYEEGLETSPYWIFNRDKKRAYLFDQQQKKLVPLEEESSEHPDGYDENESLLSHVADRENRNSTFARRVLEGWNVHHDVHVERGSMMRRPATTQLTRKLAADGSNLVTVLHTLYTGSKEFRSLIDEGMSAGFEGEYDRLEFRPAAAQQIQLAVQWKSSSRPHAGSDLSDGTLRFLFLLTVLSHPEPAALVAIDEPETGLHPSMFPVIAEYAEAASEHTQVVLTSHSPEFLDAFTGMSPHVSVCHWEQGQTHLYGLAPETLGRWLERYKLGHLFTRGDLESLAQEPVEPIADLDDRLKDLPSEDEAMSTLPTEPEGDVNA
ncbi:MAG TPA: AAA family ATPase [Thermoguttaceae bacterium]|nr:AAA family ATPase [Thermoguttaceae bacterium]